MHPSPAASNRAFYQTLFTASVAYLVACLLFLVRAGLFIKVQIVLAFAAVFWSYRRLEEAKRREEDEAVRTARPIGRG